VKPDTTIANMVNKDLADKNRHEWDIW